MHIYPSLMRIATIRNKSFGRHHFHDKLPLSEFLINLRMIDFQTWIRTFHFCAFIEGTMNLFLGAIGGRSQPAPKSGLTKRFRKEALRRTSNKISVRSFRFPWGLFFPLKILAFLSLQECYHHLI